MNLLMLLHIHAIVPYYLKTLCLCPPVAFFYSSDIGRGCRALID
jgi:hypothetical protein